MESEKGIGGSTRRRGHRAGERKAKEAHVAKEEHVSFRFPKWIGAWAALACCCTAAVVLLDLPSFANALLYLTTLGAGFEFMTEIYGVRVTPSSVVFPVRPNVRFPFLSLWVQSIELDAISRVTARKTSAGFQLVSMKTAAGDIPVYLPSHLKRREFSHLLGQLRPALVFRKTR